MIVSTSDLRSKLARARGLGPAKHGVSHWVWQRVTAVALVPLSLWFVASLICGMLMPDAAKVAEWFASPVHAVLMALFLMTLFFHAKLGVQVIIEDYVKCPYSKYGLLLLNIFCCVGLAAVSVLAILKLHFLDVVSGGV